MWDESVPPATERVPGVVVSHVPASTGAYVGSPSIAVLPCGDYVATHDIFGPNSGEEASGVTLVFRSRDRGATWRRVGEVQGQFWSSLFYHRGALYLFGTNGLYRDAVIRRSEDEGATWTRAVDAASGLLTSGGRWHCAPTPVVEHAGRLWRAMERRPLKSQTFAGAFSAPAGCDLLDAANWTFSDPVVSDPAWLGGDFCRWLEGNIIVDPAGELVDLLRITTNAFPDAAAMLHLAPDGHGAAFDPAKDLMRILGGGNKFTIRPDPRGKLYWSLINVAPKRYHAGTTACYVRNTLALACSRNLRDWDVRCALLHHPDRFHHAFQYVDWLFDGEDLIAVSRTAYDDGLGGAHTYHDANYMTFHRVKAFRGERPSMA
ncbi:MAG TPA: sialidase family protein [Candidatus Brocadiia bacterium]|nr:sialidase family protein [Candidatus Brocadiia bacterium]